MPDRDLPARLRGAGLTRGLADRPAPHLSVAGQQHLGVQHAPARPGCATQPSSSWLNTAGSSCGPLRGGDRVPGDQGVAADQHAVDDVGAVPAGVAGGRDRPSARPAGRRRRPRSAPVRSGCPSRISAPLRTDRPPTTSATAAARHVHGDIDRRGLFAGTPAWRGPPRRRGSTPVCRGSSANQIAEPKWSMWAWVSRIARTSSAPKPSSAQRGQHVVAAAGEAGVDQHDAGVVGDQRPVDQVGVREMDAVGDGASEPACASVGRARLGRRARVADRSRNEGSG